MSRHATAHVLLTVLELSCRHKRTSTSVTSITFPRLQYFYISDTVGLNFTDSVYNCVADDKSDLAIARDI